MATQSNDLIGKLEDVNKSLPALPKNVKDIFVMIAPWFALVAGVLGIFATLSAFGIFSALNMGTGMMGGFNGMIYVYLVIGLVTSVIDLMAFMPLRVKRMKGWTLLFWSEVITLVVNVVSFSVLGVVFSLAYLYILFQIRSSYK